MGHNLNVRKGEVMDAVTEDVKRYRSELVERIKRQGSVLELPGMKIRLARAFGFCDGVQRAIEMAHAACHLLHGTRIRLIGEIIHNPEVNAQLDALGLLHLPWNTDGRGYEQLTAGDAVIIPAFGVSTELQRLLEEKGVQLIDSTCGNVIKVWQRVRNYARRGITSIIHGKAHHEESMATASRSRGEDGQGRFLIIYSREDARILSDYIRRKTVDRRAFLQHFDGAYSPGFDPDRDLKEIGMANQTTMLKNETAQLQRMLRQAVIERDGNDANFHAFDTICGATQDRQQALYDLLETKPDCVFIIGGYNSSNTSHLADISAARLPTYFVRDAACLHSLQEVLAYNTSTRREELRPLPPSAQRGRQWSIGITAGASCPANIIEGVIRRLADLRGVSID